MLFSKTLLPGTAHISMQPTSYFNNHTSVSCLEETFEHVGICMYFMGKKIVEKGGEQMRISSAFRTKFLIFLFNYAI